MPSHIKKAILNTNNISPGNTRSTWNRRKQFARSFFCTNGWFQNWKRHQLPQSFKVFVHLCEWKNPFIAVIATGITYCHLVESRNTNVKWPLSPISQLVIGAAARPVMFFSVLWMSHILSMCSIFSPFFQPIYSQLCTMCKIAHFARKMGGQNFHKLNAILACRDYI